MPHWWGKSSSKEGKKKVKRESIFDTIQQKFKNASQKKCKDKSGGSRRHHVEIVSQKGSRSVVTSRSPSPSAHVSRCQSFVDIPLSQPTPFPGLNLPTVSDVNSGSILTSKLERVRGSKPSLYLSLPKCGNVSNRGYLTDAEGEIVTASVSCDCSTDSGDSSGSHLVSPLATDYESGNKGTINGCFRLVHKDQSALTIKNTSRTSSKLAPQLCITKNLSTSPKRSRLHMQNLKIARSCGLCSAPASSISSPSRSPKRALGPERVLNYALLTGKPYPDAASKHDCSPVSGISGGGDHPGQVFVPQNRCNHEYSPMPSPRIISSSPSSRIQSGTVTPMHPHAGALVAEIPARRLDDVNHQTHPLPLPPVTTTNHCPVSPNYSASTTPAASRSPVRAENPTNQGTCWKKGKLIGRGTFGHVYLGFDRESGEMCAMKEVTLFSDDAKSRECAQQLGQEIAVLSQLQHPNIVRYYGSETVDDKLYIYLEYVSGGSIYKLLQEYGELGESAIRNYTRQILSGLAYLHAKNTVHRDIKGANILVDPNGGIKLADFGMAKHITGQACPFSFKGSPYWMAPEVIRNSTGCSLAVDIWSLGCTVLEMAMTKPPWSQFEGVAAMFKILYSKDLPEIPEHLSEDGKDFVRLCLQRNPQRRPSAAQLLEHPFVVRKVTPERPIIAYRSELPQSVINALKSMAIGPVKYNLESEAASTHTARNLRTDSGSRDAHAPRTKSCPLSPTGNLQVTTGRVLPSPLATSHYPLTPSTPVIHGGPSSSHMQKQPMRSQEAAAMIQRNPWSRDGFLYQEQELRRDPHPFRQIHQLTSADDDALVNHYRRVAPRESHHLPQMHLRDYMQQVNSSSSSRKPDTPRFGNRNDL